MPIPNPAFCKTKEFQTLNRDYIKSRIEGVKSAFDWQKDEPKNYIEYFIKEVNENKKNHEFDMKYFDEEYLIHIN